MKKRDLNDIKGRIAEARKAEWQKLLVDRWHSFFLNEYKETDDDLCQLCSAP